VKGKPGRIAVGTGSWLYSSTSQYPLSSCFREFRDDFDDKNKTLACPGYPGAGKTVRAVVVKDHLEELRNSFSKPHETAVSALYLGHIQLKEKLYRDIILYLLRDLARQCHGSGPQHELVNKIIRIVRDKKSPTDEAVFEAFDSMCQPLRAFFIIIDGLEEYKWDQLQGLLDFLDKLQSKHSPRIKMYVTFRPMEDIAKRFDTCKSFSVLANDDDVEKFIDNEIQASKKLSRFVVQDPELPQMIKSAILDVSDTL
jgi:Cdc6-like AAA superfamily ATPase